MKPLMCGLALLAVTGAALAQEAANAPVQATLRGPAPLATTRGARIVLASYCSATAKWVGFVITTSAFGTACIIRRCRVSVTISLKVTANFS